MVSEIKRQSAGKAIVFTNSTSVTDLSITIKHEFGDVVKAETVVAAGPVTTYTYNLTKDDTRACGLHRVIWKYTEGASSKTQTAGYQVIQEYISLGQFLTDNPGLSSVASSFTKIERQARQIINTYCGQEFYFIPEKTIRYDGQNRSSLWTGMRVDDLIEVKLDGVTDITEYIEIAPDTRRALRRKKYTDNFDSSTIPSVRYFKSSSVYHVKANWGWHDIPTNIADAAAILISDIVNDDRAYWKHGVSEVYMDTDRLRFHHDMIQGTTGNIEADVLLMDYILFTMDFLGE